ncbi:MAG: hypothetical protein ACK55I_13315, partial [bacterium]
DWAQDNGVSDYTTIGVLEYDSRLVCKVRVIFELCEGVECTHSRSSSSFPTIFDCSASGRGDPV